MGKRFVFRGRKTICGEQQQSSTDKKRYNRTTLKLQQHNHEQQSVMQRFTINPAVNQIQIFIHQNHAGFIARFQ